jgi:hypothetical protein
VQHALDEGVPLDVGGGAALAAAPGLAVGAEADFLRLGDVEAGGGVLGGLRAGGGAEVDFVKFALGGAVVLGSLAC